MAAPNFEIRISGYPGEDPEGRSSLGAELTPEERELAQKFGVTEEQFQRSKLALAEKADRVRARAVKLGHVVESILGPLGAEYALEGVARNIDTLSWTLRVRTPRAVVNVPVSWELVDDVLDSGTKTESDRLRNMVLFAINRRDLIFQKR
jgi:hypothetical protein